VATAQYAQSFEGQGPAHLAHVPHLFVERLCTSKAMSLIIFIVLLLLGKGKAFHLSLGSGTRYSALYRIDSSRNIIPHWIYWRPGVSNDKPLHDIVQEPGWTMLGLVVTLYLVIF